MKMNASMAWRDSGLAGVLVLGLFALLCSFSPFPPSVLLPSPLLPAVITYQGGNPPPADQPAADNHEHNYEEWRSGHSPALIALSASIMLPQTKRAETPLVAPPLEAGAPSLRFPVIAAMEQENQVPLLSVRRSRTILTGHPQAATTLVKPGAWLTPPFYRVDLSGDLRGQSVDLTPLEALPEPAGPWSFSAVLHYDQTGRVRHALLESASLEETLRAEVASRIYQCRVTPAGTAGEGRLTVFGPGRSARP